MAWFKFGKQDDAKAVQKPAAESVEALRQRAKRRLIGSVVLVLAGVVGFPLLFDTQPRPVAIDVPIEIPDKNKVKPLAPPAPSNAPLTPAPAARVDDKSAAVVEGKASLGDKEEIVTPARNTSAPTATKTVSSSTPTNPAPVAPAAPATGTADAAKAAAQKAAADKAAADKAAADKKAAEKKAADKAAADKAAADKAATDKKAAETARAKALLEGKGAATPAAAATGERFIVQFGSFSDVTKAREVRQKVEKAGLKTYSQVADTAGGKLIRVRVGPFATRAEADKAAAKIKSLDLPAAVLTL
jgi:DedD protein